MADRMSIESGKKWCEHLNENVAYNGGPSIPGGYAEAAPLRPMNEKWNFCPVCGSKRPDGTVGRGKEK